jgi:hypothetical protein
MILLVALWRRRFGGDDGVDGGEGEVMGVMAGEKTLDRIFS